MVKNIAIAVLIVIILAESAYIVKTHHSKEEATEHTVSARITQQPVPGNNQKRPSFLAAGMKFQDSPLFSKAYKIVPGSLSADAQKVLTGWDLKQQTLADGSIQVNLIPHDADDVQQEFIVKPEYTLYFIEMNLADDTTQKDENRQDDMGVLVDQNGIIQ